MDNFEADTPMPPSPPTATQKCCKIWCRRMVSIGETSCETCKENNRKAQQRRRAAQGNTSGTTSRKRKDFDGEASTRPAARPRRNSGSEDEETPVRGCRESGDEDSDDECMYGNPDENQVLQAFEDAETFCDALKAEMKTGKAVNFNGTYPMLVDPLVSPRTRVQMVAKEVWTLTGYRFT
ncbi:hypothetical protein R3P38DRAFT_2555475 [Favolaschia claudopus]|uniref:Uncharacterized protein n=1 Tax=Favolaschia claudopus TaxID=2862362 RepID=A0AAW0AB27_9AGAR